MEAVHQATQSIYLICLIWNQFGREHAQSHSKFVVTKNGPN